MTAIHPARPTARPAPLAPGALPVVGHLRQLLTDPTGFLTSLPAHGDLVEIRLGPRPTYVVCGPELVAQVLLTGRRDYDKGGPFFENIAVFFGDGLATCPDAKHTRLRRLTQPAFHPGKLADYQELAGREIAAVLGTWREGQVLDVYRVMQELALRITVSTMFASWFAHTDTAAETVQRTLADVDTLVSGAFLRMVAPGLARLPLAANRRYEQARLSLYARIDETVAAYRRDGTDHGDLLSMLLAEDGDGSALSDAEVREQVMTMFIAGIGTTAAMLAWTLHYLSVDDALDAVVAQEARRARGTAARDEPHRGCRFWPTSSPRPSGSGRPPGCSAGSPCAPPSWAATGSRPEPTSCSARTSSTTVPTCSRSRNASTPGAGAVTHAAGRRPNAR
ncbi:cytochrome P450 [Streptomyces diastatochromogenes]|nr:cytochrome P450 [Streptomyces diastatochromogenes]